MTIYIQKPAGLWEQLGNLAGNWGAYRLGQLRDTQQAKATAEALGLNKQQNQQGIPQNGYLGKYYDPNTGTWDFARADDAPAGGATQEAGTMNAPIESVGTQAPPITGVETQATPMQQGYNFGVNGIRDTPGLFSGLANQPQPLSLTGQEPVGLFAGKEPPQPAYTQNDFRYVPNFISGVADTKPFEEAAPNGYAMPDRSAIRAASRQGMGQALVDMVKAGIDRKEALGLLMDKATRDEQSQWESAVSTYQENVLDPLRNQIMEEAAKEGYDPKRNKKLGAYVDRYNVLARKVGLQGIDMNGLLQLASIDKPNYKYMTTPNQHLVAINGNEVDPKKAITDTGSYASSKLQVMPNGATFMVTTDGQITKIGNFAKQKLQQVGNKIYQTGDDGSLKFIGLAVEPRSSTTRTPTMRDLVTVQKEHERWKREHPDYNESQSPFYAPLQRIQASLGTSSQPTNEDVTGGQTLLVKDEEALKKEIMDNYYQWGTKATQAKLREKGFGFYATWVPDDGKR